MSTNDFILKENKLLRELLAVKNEEVESLQSELDSVKTELSELKSDFKDVMDKYNSLKGSIYPDTIYTKDKACRTNINPLTVKDISVYTTPTISEDNNTNLCRSDRNFDGKVVTTLLNTSLNTSEYPTEDQDINEHKSVGAQIPIDLNKVSGPDSKNGKDTHSKHWHDVNGVAIIDDGFLGKVSD